MRHESAYQVLASQVLMVANDDGSKSGYLCVVNKFFFVHLKLELKVKINAHGKKKRNPTRTMRLIIFSQPSVFIRGRLSGAIIASCCLNLLSFTWPNPLTLS